MSSPALLDCIVALTCDVTDSFDDFWRVAAKLTPTAGPPIRSTSPQPTGSALSRPQSSDNNNAPPDRDGAYSMRNVPIRLYLPDGPVLQELAPPSLEDGGRSFFCAGSLLMSICAGSPNTLYHLLSTHLPLLFPPRPPPPPPSRLNPNPSAPAVPVLAYALIQGVVSPPEAELAWLGACLAGADGWLNICIGVSRS